MACSNMSVAYLNYPTQVIFKSCKLIPVMIGGILIQVWKPRAEIRRSELLFCARLGAPTKPIVPMLFLHMLI